MVMQYHWGLGVGHIYAHGQGIGSEILQNQTSEWDEHDREADDWNEDIHYFFPNLSDNSKDEGGTDSGSESADSSWDDEDNDSKDCNTLDYQS